MIRDIMGAIAKRIKNEFGCSVYSTEVARGYKLPCFFIEPVPTAERYTHNVMRKKLTVILTYMAAEQDMIASAAVYERILALFQTGIEVGSRHLHAPMIMMSMAGEDNTDMQIELIFDYYEAIPHETTADIAEEVMVNISQRSDKEWQN